MTRPTLDPVEVRVLGALVEKAFATPDQYPLTLNAVLAACNQKTSRDPVMTLSDRDVRGALDRLGRRGLVGTTAGAGHRVAKFRHNLDRALDLSRGEITALALLMLRGPQTSGEIRTRSTRMADFPSVEAADEAIWMLTDREEPLVAVLPRQPGQAADRYVHLLSGEPDAAETPASDPDAVPSGEEAPAPTEELRPDSSSLAVRVSTLEQDVADLRAQLAAFRAQFE